MTNSQRGQSQPKTGFEQKQTKQTNWKGTRQNALELGNLFVCFVSFCQTSFRTEANEGNKVKFADSVAFCHAFFLRFEVASN